MPPVTAISSIPPVDFVRTTQELTARAQQARQQLIDAAVAPTTAQAQALRAVTQPPTQGPLNIPTVQQALQQPLNAALPSAALPQPTVSQVQQAFTQQAALRDAALQRDDL